LSTARKNLQRLSVASISEQIPTHRQLSKLPRVDRSASLHFSCWSTIPRYSFCRG
jgi:hypothetical protein